MRRTKAQYWYLCWTWLRGCNIRERCGDQNVRVQVIFYTRPRTEDASLVNCDDAFNDDLSGDKPLLLGDESDFSRVNDVMIRFRSVRTYFTLFTTFGILKTWKEIHPRTGQRE